MNIDIKYPTTWQQVTSAQLLIIATQMLKKRTREELLFDIFCKLTGLRLRLKAGIEEGTPAAEYSFRKDKLNFTVPISTIHTACEELSYLIDSIGLPECPIISVNSKLYGITFKQYYFADAYFRRYQETKDMKSFLSMYEALTGKTVKDLEPEYGMAITIWWTGLKSFFKDKYSHVFAEGDGEASEKSPADTLQEILSILNNNQPQENIKILETEVNSVLLSLDNIYSIAKRNVNS